MEGEGEFSWDSGDSQGGRSPWVMPDCQWEFSSASTTASHERLGDSDDGGVYGFGSASSDEDVRHGFDNLEDPLYCQPPPVVGDDISEEFLQAGSLPHDSGTAPPEPTVVAQPPDLSQARSTKKRRQTHEQQALQPRPPSSTMNGPTANTRLSMETLSFETAGALLIEQNTQRARCSGQRPDYLCTAYSSSAEMAGLIFKEEGQVDRQGRLYFKRRYRTDAWYAAGGPKGSSCETVIVDGGHTLTIRRKYGKLTLKNPKSGQPLYTLRFHEYNIVHDDEKLANVAAAARAAGSVDGSASPHRTKSDSSGIGMHSKLYHILPLPVPKVEQQSRRARLQAKSAQMKSDGASRKEQMQEDEWEDTCFDLHSQTKTAATAGQPLPCVVDDEKQTQGQRKIQHGKVIQGLLTLQMGEEADEAEEDDDDNDDGQHSGQAQYHRWIAFRDKNGIERGSIGIEGSGQGNVGDDRSAGVVLRSHDTGDFAEWHPRMPGERRLFEQGDVVGFWAAPDGTSSPYDGRSSYYISLKTIGAKQLGVISRQAIVEGSCPFGEGLKPSSWRATWDTVAYCGRVPVKLIGSSTGRAGDSLVPSGREDGTAKALSSETYSNVRLGILERDACPIARVAARGEIHSGTCCDIDPEPIGANISVDQDSAQDSRGSQIELLPLSSSSSMAEPAAQAGKHFSDAAWQLVDCSVVAPSLTVMSIPIACGHKQSDLCRNKMLSLLSRFDATNRCHMVLMFACVSLAAMVTVLSTNLQSAHGCVPIELLVHGTLEGGCDGTEGSTCIYACDPGYVLVPDSTHAHSTTDHHQLLLSLLPDAPLSAQATNPVGGSLIQPQQLPSVRHQQPTPLLQFPPCISCFTTDGLMCQPERTGNIQYPTNRSKDFPFPLKLIPPPWSHNSNTADFLTPEDPYDCPSDPQTLINCIGSNTESQGERSVCYGPFDGFKPCELCETMGDSPETETETVVERAEHTSTSTTALVASHVAVHAVGGYAVVGRGLACEATSRGVPWGRRRDWGMQRYDTDEHRICLSSTKFSLLEHPVAQHEASLDHCRHLGYQQDGTPKSDTVGFGGSIAFPDDIDRIVRLCAPLDAQQQWREKWQQQKQVADIDMTESNDAVRLLSPQNAPADEQINVRISRYCSRRETTAKGSKTEYSGTAMVCIPSGRTQYRFGHCPAEVIGALRNQVCLLCAGKEAQLRVPRTQIGIATIPQTEVIDNATEASMTKVVRVVVPCPAGFTGHVVRSCSNEGWLNETPLAGPGCVRKRCLAIEVSLNSTYEKTGGSNRVVRSGLSTVLSHKVHNTSTAILATSLEGTGRVSTPCPAGYRGNISAVCAEDADQWTDLRTQCELELRTQVDMEYER
eukprot:COSAG02_NODE_493_length_21166_cov_13.181318_13_plen_1358_part_00